MPVRSHWSRISLSARLAIAVARMRRVLDRPSMRPARVLTLVLGAALSVGGVSHAFDDVHFLLEKNVDSLKVLRQDGPDQKLVASVKGPFASSSIYRLARVFPESLVSEESSLFDSRLLLRAEDPKVLTEKLSIIRNDIRREFFASAIPFGDIIHDKAEKYDVDPSLVAAVVETESRFRHHATSQRGAQGLMQLMPRTGQWLGASNLYDPDQNLDAGVKYLKYLQQRFDGNLKNTIAAYNAGEGNVKHYGGVPPYPETQMYVQKVLASYHRRNEQLRQYDEATPSTDRSQSDR